MENGELVLWNPKAILSGNSKEATIQRFSIHKGSVKGLDFNPIQPNILASGSVSGQVYLFLLFLDKSKIVICLGFKWRPF